MRQSIVIIPAIIGGDITVVLWGNTKHDYQRGAERREQKMQEIGETFVGMTALQMPDIDKLPAFQVWFPRDPRAPTAKKNVPKAR